MPRESDFPQSDNNTEARRARLLKSQLANLSREFHPLIQESFTIEKFDIEIQIEFLNKLGETIRKLLKLNPFGDNQKLKTECEEVLVIAGERDTNQIRKCVALVSQLSNFFS